MSILSRINGSAVSGKQSSIASSRKQNISRNIFLYDLEDIKGLDNERPDIIIFHHSLG